MPGSAAVPYPKRKATLPPENTPPSTHCIVRSAGSKAGARMECLISAAAAAIPSKASDRLRKTAGSGNAINKEKAPKGIKAMAIDEV